MSKKKKATNKQRSEIIQVFVPVAVADELKTLADANCQSLSGFVRQLCVDELREFKNAA